MSKNITQKMFEQMVRENNKYSEIIGEYKGMRNSVLCKCLICGETYSAIAQDVKNGKKHRKCATVISAKKRTKSNEQFLSEIHDINPYIDIIGKYITSKEKIECHCNIHDINFLSDPDHLLTGETGCYICKNEKISNANTLPYDEFLEKLFYKNNNNFLIIGEYKCASDKLQVKCNVCGFEWEPIASSLLNGSGCPHCAGRYKTTEEFINEIAKINPNIRIIGEYYNATTKIQCLCLKCGHTWFAKPSNLHYSGCPTCNISKGEKRIIDFLDNHNIQYEYQKKYDDLLGVGNRNLSYDFGIFLDDERNYVLLEYQGEFHDGTAHQQTYEEYLIQLEHDRRKREYAKNNNIKLIEIWYWDFDNIEKILQNELC